MLALVDNDFILKLAAYNMIGAALDCMGVEEGNVRCLPSVPFKWMKRRGDLEKSMSPEAVDRAIAFVKRCAKLSGDVDPDAQAMLHGVPGINTGEEVLAAAAYANQTSLIATGDKAFLSSLARHPQCRPVYDSLSASLLNCAVIQRSKSYSAAVSTRNTSTPLKGSRHTCGDFAETRVIYWRLPTSATGRHPAPKPRRGRTACLRTRRVRLVLRQSPRAGSRCGWR